MQVPTYFLIVGLGMALVLALISANYQKNQGHSFFQTFLFGWIGMSGLILGLWSYLFF
jgi:uncharacterized membrane protein YczE